MREQIYGCLNIKALTFIVKSKASSTLSNNKITRRFCYLTGCAMRLLCHDVTVDASLKTEIFTFSALTSQCLFSYSLFMCSHIFPHISSFRFLSTHLPFLFAYIFPLRCDITAILLYVEQLLLSLCGSPEALVQSNPSSAIAIISGVSDWPYQIHSLCEQLLTVLVIVTAPLPLLYRFVPTFLLYYLKIYV